MSLFLKQYSPLDEELKGSVSNYWDAVNAVQITITDAGAWLSCAGLGCCSGGRVSFKCEGWWCRCTVLNVRFRDVFSWLCHGNLPTTQESERAWGDRMCEKRKKNLATHNAGTCLNVPPKKTPRLTLAETHGHTDVVLSPCYHLSLSHTHIHIHTDR